MLSRPTLVPLPKFAANWNAARSAKKRGGGHKIFSFEFDDGEQRYQREPVDGWTAERLFDRRWALQLLEDDGFGVHENGFLIFLKLLRCCKAAADDEDG